MIKVKTIRWAGYVAHLLKQRNAHRTVVEKPEEMRVAGISTGMWEDKVKWVINI
jgi:hypothetical protein